MLCRLGNNILSKCTLPLTLTCAGIARSIDKSGTSTDGNSYRFCICKVCKVRYFLTSCIVAACKCGGTRAKEIIGKLELEVMQLLGLQGFWQHQVLRGVGG